MSKKKRFRVLVDLPSRVGTLEAERETLNYIIGQYGDDIDELTQRLGKLERRVETLEAERETLKNDLRELVDLLREGALTLFSLAQQVAKHDGTIEDLKSKRPQFSEIDAYIISRHGDDIVELTKQVSDLSVRQKAGNTTMMHVLERLDCVEHRVDCRAPAPREREQTDET